MTSDKITFAGEDKLPRLPVPTLIATVEQALDALRPLVPVEEYQRLLDKSIDFLNSPTIKILQEHLIESSKINSNYLESEGISPTTSNVYGDLRGHTLPRNPFFILEDDPLKSFAPSQAFRASILITSSLRFIAALRNQMLKPDFSPKSGNPLSMSSYANLFGTTIIPFNNGVAMKKAPSFADSRHIIIMSRSQFYKLEVLSEDNLVWFTKHELSAIIKEIIQDSNKADSIDTARHAIGAFTTEMKATWKYARLHLEKTNKDSLEIIDNALFVVSLDHEAPKQEQERVQVVSHGTSKIDQNGIQIGTCTNRYYDKLNLIITQNSVAACVYPAACMDGTTVLRYISDIYTDSVLRLARKINGNNYTLWRGTNTVPINDTIEKPTFEKIKFHLTPELKSGLHLAETRLADIIHQHEYISRTINKFGNNYIMGKMNLPSDSLVQICIQITYHALYGKMASTLEPVTTRKFKDARTEPICVQSETMLKLCQGFISQASNKQKWTLVLNAIDEHSSKVKNAIQGKGFERHLSALRSAFIQRELLYKLHPHLQKASSATDDGIIPPFIFEPSLDLLYKPELLVANCGNPALNLFGVTPAIPTGFGIGYIIKDDALAVVASSQWRQTDRFLDTFTSVIDEMKSIWKEVVLGSSSISETIDTTNTNAVPVLAKNNTGAVDGGRTSGTSRARELESYLNSIPMSLLQSNNSTMAKSSTAARPPLSNSKTSLSILGGYDYFDVGELALRSGMQTATHSGTVSRSESATDLKDLNKGIKDVGKKLIVTEEL